jgi:hypothetical protein
MRRLLSSVFLFAALCVAGVPPSAASAGQLLPETIGSWTAGAPQAGTNGLPQELIAETRQTIEFRTYTSGKRTLNIALQSYPDPSLAYEAYTAQLTVGMLPGDLKVPSAVDRADSRMILLIGNLIVDLRKSSDVSSADLQLLISSLLKKADRSPYPPIRSYLPDDGLVQGSQRYALGPAAFAAALTSLQRGDFSALTPEVDFKIGAEAMFGRYWLGKGQGDVLLLIEYPTPQLAEQHLHHLEAAMASRADAVKTTVERRGSLLSLVLAPSSANYAQVIRDRINYSTQVTWNEPSHTLTDPPWVLVLKNIFLGTLFFCGLALVLGVAFGGFRVIVKRLFPGKVFDRPESLEVLQLGLSSKPIDPKDLY